MPTVRGVGGPGPRPERAEKGSLDTLPVHRLCLLYRQDYPGKMGHAGVYLGDGTCIHAKGHNEGVVQESMECYGRWTHWAIPEGLYASCVSSPSAVAQALSLMTEAVAFLQQAVEEEKNAAL